MKTAIELKQDQTCIDLMVWLDLSPVREMWNVFLCNTSTSRMLVHLNLTLIPCVSDSPPRSRPFL